MKVLQVTNSLRTGGAEKLLLETIPLYNKNGASTDLLVLDGSDYPFMKALKSTGSCRIYSMGSGSLYNPLLALKMISKLRKYDVIHVHLFPSLYWTALAKLLSFRKINMFYTEHSTNNRRRNNALLRFADRIVYRFYKKIICISEEVKNDIQKHLGFPDDKFTVIENGVNLSNIFSETGYAADALPFPNNGFTILQVSSFRYPKDQSTVIRSLARLPETVSLVLVGEGDTLESNKQLARSLKLEGRVHFLGVRMDVNKLLKSVDAVILSSAYEGLSLSSIEGLASGRPFLATDVPGLTEIVSGAGILFPLGDDAVLAAEITKLMENRDYYINTANSGMARAKAYDIDKMIWQHIKLFHSCQ